MLVRLATSCAWSRKDLAEKLPEAKTEGLLSCPIHTEADRSDEVEHGIRFRSSVSMSKALTMWRALIVGKSGNSGRSPRVQQPRIQAGEKLLERDVMWGVNSKRKDDD